MTHAVAGLPASAYVVAFVASSLLIVWRLETLSKRQLAGTVLGTLFMPYFSGLGNLLFVYLLLEKGGFGSEIAVNALTNNVTNLCFIIAIPALFIGLDLRATSRAKKVETGATLNRLSLILTLLALIFFSGVTYVLSDDGWIDRIDGLTLVAIFFFWQCFHIYEVLKENAQGRRGWSPLIAVDLFIILVASGITLIAVEGVVSAIVASDSEILNKNHLGLLTGFLMILPNALLAIYYSVRKQPEVVYTSQVGDAHICVPLCLGAFAIFRSIPTTDFLQQGLLLLVGVGTLHVVCILFFQRLPRLVACGLIVLYGWILYSHINTPPLI